jgi:transposase
MKKQHVELREEDRLYLEELTSKGEIKVKSYQRGLALLELDRGKSYTAVAKSLNKVLSTISNWATQYEEAGLTFLEDQARSGRPAEIDGVQRAKITALACSTPPEGHSQWSLRLLAEHAVELGYVEGISHTGVRKILKKTI